MTEEGIVDTKQGLHHSISKLVGKNTTNFSIKKIYDRRLYVVKLKNIIFNFIKRNDAKRMMIGIPSRKTNCIYGTE